MKQYHQNEKQKKKEREAGGGSNHHHFDLLFFFKNDQSAHAICTVVLALFLQSHLVIQLKRQKKRERTYRFQRENATPGVESMALVSAGGVSPLSLSRYRDGYIDLPVSNMEEWRKLEERREREGEHG